MTWEELKEKAINLNYSICNGFMHPSKQIIFFENNVVSIGEEVFTNISYEDMQKLMELLK